MNLVLFLGAGDLRQQLSVDQILWSAGGKFRRDQIQTGDKRNAQAIKIDCDSSFPRFFKLNAGYVRSVSGAPKSFRDWYTARALLGSVLIQRSRSLVKRGSACWMTAYPPMTRYLTLLSLKRLNRSVKSELTNIETLYSGVVHDKFPGRGESRRRRLRLPEGQIERSIQLQQFASAF